MIWFIVGLVIGFVIGFLYLAYGQISLERGYVRNKLAKLDGSYYRITPINEVEEDWA